MHLPMCGTWPAVITHSPMYDVLTRVHGEPLLCYSNRKINSLLMLFLSCFVLRLQSITNAKSSHVPLLSPLSFSLLLLLSHWAICRRLVRLRLQELYRTTRTQCTRSTAASLKGRWSSSGCVTISSATPTLLSETRLLRRTGKLYRLNRCIPVWIFLLILYHTLTHSSHTYHGTF